MKILFWLSGGWHSYLANSNIALCEAIENDNDIVPAYGYSTDPRDDLDAVVVDSISVPLPPWLPDDIIKFHLGDDLHHFTETARDPFTEAAKAYDILLTPYYFAKPQQPNCYFWPTEETRRKLVWFPHWVPDKQPPISASRGGGVLIGCTDSRVYPWRAWLKSLALPDLTVVQHPGYDDPTAMIASREAFFPTLARHKVGFTDNLILDYTVAKYFEIPFAGCLLVAQRPNAMDAKLLGFEDSRNCVFIDGQDEQDVRRVYAMALSGQYDKVSEHGHWLIRQRHTASCRLAYLKRLILWYKDHRRVPNSDEQAAIFSAT